MAASDSTASILLVDDHPENLLALEAILEPLGQRLVRARSGEEALRQLLHEEFACIVLDVQMPVLDGFETAKLIKGRERSRHTPLLFLTAYYREPRDVLQGYAQGAVDYLVKPFDPDILRTKVAVFVDLHLQLRRAHGRARLSDAERSLRLHESRERLHAALAALQRERLPLPGAEAVLAALPVGAGALDVQLRYLHLNPALAALHGAHAEPGRSLWELDPELAEAAQACVQSREPASGTAGRLHFRLDPAPQGLELLAVDAARPQALQQALRLLDEAAARLVVPLDEHHARQAIARRIVAHVVDGCLVDRVGAHGRLEPAALAHVRPEREELLRALGAGPGLLPAARLRCFAEQRTQVLRPSPEALLGHDGAEAEHRLLRALGPEAAFVVTPLHGGTLTFLCDSATFTFGEEELALLEEVAAHAGAALERARLYRAAQDAAAAQAGDTLPHRLRALQQALKQHALKEQPPAREALEAMARELGRLSRLRERLGAMQPGAPVDLREVVRDTALHCTREAAAGAAHVELQGLEQVLGHWDRERLRQLVGGLLFHAFDHSCGTPVHVELSAHGGLARLVVRDEGIGLAPEDLQRLAASAEGAAPVQGEPGVLAQARQLAAALGGSLTLHASPGRGSAVEVTLPQRL